MKGLQVLRRGFSTSAFRNGAVRDPKNPGFMVPKSNPDNWYTYENLVVKRMRKYLEPSKEFTHNRTPLGKPFTLFVCGYFVVWTTW